MGVRAVAALLAVGVVAGACTAGSEQAMPTGPSPSAVDADAKTDVASPSPSPSDAGADYSALLVEHVGDPGFSARFSITGREEQPAGVIRRAGAGAVVGDDSELWVVDNLAGLDRALFATGHAHGVIGPGGRTANAMASKLVDGTMYEQDVLGHWHAIDAEDPDTQPGYVFSALREVASFDVVGSQTVDGEDLVELRPSAAIDYDLTRLALNPALEGDLTAETRVLVDSDGVPVRVTIQAQAPSHEYAWSVVYDLDDVRDVAGIEPPSETWVAAASRGFGLVGATGLPVAHFEIPSSWDTETLGADVDEGILVAQLPGGGIFQAAVYLNLDADPKTAMEDFAAMVGVSVMEAVQLELGGHPTALGYGEAGAGFGMSAAQVLLGDAVLVAAWAGLPTDANDQIADFMDVLQTVVPVNPDAGLLPGNTAGGSELQADAADAVSAVAVVATGEDCQSAEVLWTEVTSSRQQAWTEDWVVEACGDLQLHEVGFVRTSDGGTDIQVPSAPFRFAEADSPRGHDQIVEDPELAAALLAEQPWLVDPSLDVSEADVARSVQAARFHGTQLYVLVLGEAFSGKDNTDDYIDTVFAHLANGMLLVFTPDWVTSNTMRAPEDPADIQDALDAATGQWTTERAVRSFVTTLHPEAHDDL